MIYLPLIIILTFGGAHSMKNGRRADNIESQFIVSIRQHLFHLCSGTIIDTYHILTAAHVVVPHLASNLSVVPGMSVARWPFDSCLKVRNIYPHPHYQKSTVSSDGQSEQYWENDIAILRLKEPVLLSFTIGVAPLSTTNLESYHCFGCTILSWNHPDESDLDSVVLMWDIVTLLEDRRCEQFGIHVLANQQCFIDLFETAFISTEDLGSPIICGNSMVGLIVKEARQGDATSPAVFLSTINHAQFISEVINGEIQSERKALKTLVLALLQFPGGETDVQPGEFPYVVSIWRHKKHVCGGVIVNANQVVTAGQCIQSTNTVDPIEEFKIAAGSTAATLYCDSMQWYEASSLTVHPDYQPCFYANDPICWREHDIGLITLSTSFLWSPTIQSLRLADSDSSTKQYCQILHWNKEEVSYRRDYRILMKGTAVLDRKEQLLVQLGAYQITVKELYAINNARPADIGNPIICEGHPLGIMVRIHGLNVKSQDSQIVFLRIRPYVSMGFFKLQ